MSLQSHEAPARRSRRASNVADQHSAPGWHRIAPKLYLRVREGEGGNLQKSWVYRAKLHGKPRRWTLGDAAEMSAAQALDKAREYKIEVDAGREPGGILRPMNAAGVRIAKYLDVVDEFCAKATAGMRAERTKREFKQQLVALNTGELAKLTLDQIEPDHLEAVLRPKWLSAPVQSRRVRVNLFNLFEFARAKGYRPKGKENPATRATLLELLPRQPRHRKKHYAAMPYEDVPTFAAKVANDLAMSAKGLRFMLWTVARTIEVRRATWSQIDFERAVWVIPEDKMKGYRKHRVPLSEGCMAFLRKQHETRRGPYVFPGVKGGQMSSFAMLARLWAMGYRGEITNHGFRSSFKEWGRVNHPHDRELVELSLSHLFGDETERAYGRDDLLEQRRPLMQAWDDYLMGWSAKREPLKLAA